MILPDNVIELVKEEAVRVHHGSVEIVINETSDVVDVVTHHRQRFEKSEKKENKNIIEKNKYKMG